MPIDVVALRDEAVAAAQRGDLAVVSARLNTLSQNLAETATQLGLSETQAKQEIQAAAASFGITLSPTGPTASQPGSAVTKVVTESAQGTITSTTTATQAPKTAEELTLIQKQTELVDLELTQLKKQATLLGDLMPNFKQMLQFQVDAAAVDAGFRKALLEAQAPLLAAQIKSATGLVPIAEEMFKLQLPAIQGQLALLTKTGQAADVALTAQRTAQVVRDRLLADLGETSEQAATRRAAEENVGRALKGEVLVSPQQQAAIDAVFDPMERRGTEALRQFAEETAARRGLKLTDTPIGETVLPEIRRFQEGLAGAKAQTTLSVGKQQADFSDAIRRFQEDLRQRALTNRIQLGQPGTPFVPGGSVAAAGVPFSPVLPSGGQTPSFSLNVPGINAPTGGGTFAPAVGANLPTEPPDRPGSLVFSDIATPIATLGGALLSSNKFLDWIGTLFK